MSNDLISRKSLMECAEYDDKFRLVVPYEKIKNAKTAYDVDAVCEELEEELRLADKEKERCIEENPLQFDSAKGYSNGIANAIEIVRNGGKNSLKEMIF